MPLRIVVVPVALVLLLLHETSLWLRISGVLLIGALLWARTLRDTDRHPA